MFSVASTRTRKAWSGVAPNKSPAAQRPCQEVGDQALDLLPEGDVVGLEDGEPRPFANGFLDVGQQAADVDIGPSGLIGRGDCARSPDQNAMAGEGANHVNPLLVQRTLVRIAQQGADGERSNDIFVCRGVRDIVGAVVVGIHAGSVTRRRNVDLSAAEGERIRDPNPWKIQRAIAIVGVQSLPLALDVTERDVSRVWLGTVEDCKAVLHPLAVCDHVRLHGLGVRRCLEIRVHCVGDAEQVDVILFQRVDACLIGRGDQGSKVIVCTESQVGCPYRRRLAQRRRRSVRRRGRSRLTAFEVTSGR